MVLTVKCLQLWCTELAETQRPLCKYSQPITLSAMSCQRWATLYSCCCVLVNKHQDARRLQDAILIGCSYQATVEEEDAELSDASDAGLAAKLTCRAKNFVCCVLAFSRMESTRVHASGCSWKAFSACSAATRCRQTDRANKCHACTQQNSRTTVSNTTLAQGMCTLAMIL